METSQAPELTRYRTEDYPCRRSIVRSDRILRQALIVSTLLPPLRHPSLGKTYGLFRDSFHRCNVHGKHDRVWLPMPPPARTELA